MTIRNRAFVKPGAIVLAGAGVLFVAFYGWSLNYAAATYLLTRQSTMWNAVVGQGLWRAPFDQVMAYWGHPVVSKLITLSIGLTAVEAATIGAAGALLVLQPWKVKAPKSGARIATMEDLRKAGLLNGKPGYSILLGTYRGHQVRYSGDSHIYVNGPTRSGKGVGFVLTNGFEWRGSLIGLDVKKEMWQEVGPARLAMGQEVFLFSPGSDCSHCWNPLDTVSAWPRRATEIDTIANTLIPLPLSGDSFWAKTARSLFSGLLGYVLDSKRMEGRRTIRSALRLLSTGKDLAKVFKEILEAEPDLHSYVVDKFNQHISRDPEQRPSFEAHVMTALSAWNGELVASVTSRSDFDVSQLRRRPFTIFVGTPAGDFGSVEALIRLFIQLTHDVLMRELPKPDEPHKLLMMLDEFYQFGRLPEIVDRAPLVAGYGFKIAIIAQNIPQLDARYGKPIRDMLLGNTDVKLNIAIGDKATADYVSEEFGRHYVLREGWSSSARAGQHNSSRQGRYELESLISSDAVRRFDDRKSMLLVRGHNGAILDKLHFFLDKEFCEARKRVGHFAEALNVPALPRLVEWPLFQPKPSAPELRPVESETRTQANPAMHALDAPGIPSSAPEPYHVEVLEHKTEADNEAFSLDLPAFVNLKKLIGQAEHTAHTHPVVDRLKRIVVEEASAGFVEPGMDLKSFIET